MISKEDWMIIKAQIEKGVYQKDVAEQLGVHPRTIRRALQRNGPPPRGGQRSRPRKLDPYKTFVDEQLRAGVWNTVVILRKLRELGYQGGNTMLRMYVHPKRALRSSRATVRFETAPGVQMQNDWGSVETLVGGVRAKVHFSVNTLGYSRRFHFWCTDCEDAEHTYEGVVRACEYFGGVPREVLVDNQKSTVIVHRAGQGAQFNERFLDLAGHYGFLARACRPRRARTKGKDERMVGYIKHNFFVRYRSFESFAHMNELALRWLAEEADQRVHGTVKEVVQERFSREAPHLGPLPATRYDTSYREPRLVNWDCYVDVRGNRYSVPSDYRGQSVTVRISLDDVLTVYADEEVLATHRLRSVHEGWVSVPAHHADLWREACSVQRRDLAVYEEVLRCN